MGIQHPGGTGGHDAVHLPASSRRLLLLCLSKQPSQSHQSGERVWGQEPHAGSYQLSQDLFFMASSNTSLKFKTGPSHLSSRVCRELKPLPRHSFSMSLGRCYRKVPKHLEDYAVFLKTKSFVAFGLLIPKTLPLALWHTGLGLWITEWGKKGTLKEKYCSVIYSA